MNIKKMAFCLLFSGFSLFGLQNLDEISYESLANNDFTDHVRAFRRLFELEKIDSFLEFGVGLGTKYFLDNCNSVTSIELLVRDRHSYVIPWYCDCLELFSSYSSWSPSLHVFSNAVNDANNLAIAKHDPEDHQTRYLEEISQLLDSTFENKHFDLVFVDPGMHIRGDLVNLLFGRADIIVAHDTNFNRAVYGWYKINPPDDYERIVFSYGSGVVFWIKNTRKDLIARLRESR